MQEEPQPERTLRLKLHNSVQLTPNRICCNALLAAYARARNPQWEKVSCMPSTARMHAVAAACCPVPHHQHVALQAPHMSPDTDVIYEQAMKLLEAMQQAGGTISPDAVSYNALLKACGNAAQMHVAMQARPYPPDAAVSSRPVMGLSRSAFCAHTDCIR